MAGRGGNPYEGKGYIGMARRVHDPLEVALIRANEKQYGVKEAPPLPPRQERRHASTYSRHAATDRPMATAPAPSPPPPPKEPTPPPTPLPPPPPPPKPALASNILAELLAESPAPPPPAESAEVSELKAMLNSKSTPRRYDYGDGLVDYTTAFKAYTKQSPRDWRTKPAQKPPIPDRGDMRTDFNVDKVRVRPTMSRFGEIIDVSYMMAVPPQPWDDAPPRLSQESVDKYNERTHGHGIKPQGLQKFDTEHPPDYTRETASRKVVHAGVPGYMGHCPESALGKAVIQPRDNGAHLRDRHKDRWALDQSGYPLKFPPPGYSGHLPGTVNSGEAYGTSRFVPPTKQTRSARVMSGEASTSSAAMWKGTGPSGLMMDHVNGPEKETIEEIAARHAKTRESLHRFKDTVTSAKPEFKGARSAWNYREEKADTPM